MPRKLALEVTDGVLAGKIVQFVNFNPLGIVIDSQQAGCTFSSSGLLTLLNSYLSQKV